MTEKRRSKKPTRAELEAQLAVARGMRPVIEVQIAGALLEVIAARVANGEMDVTLKNVIAEAEQRARAAAWRRRVDKMINGGGGL